MAISVSFARALQMGVVMLLIGCGKTPPVAVDEAVFLDGGPALSKLAIPGRQPMHRATVVATLTQNGEPVGDVGLAFSRSISGVARDERWKGETISTNDYSPLGYGRWGIAEIGIIEDPHGPFWRVGATGYYTVRAVELWNSSPVDGGKVFGQWHSIPIQDGTQTRMVLELEGGYRIVDRQPLLTFSRRTYVVDKIIGSDVRDTLSVAEFDAISPGFPRPLRIELYNYVPYTPFHGRVEVQRFGWLEIIDHFSERIHGSRQEQFVSGPGSFRVSSNAEPVGTVSGLSFGPVHITEHTLESSFAVSSTIISSGLTGFHAVYQPDP